MFPKQEICNKYRSQHKQEVDIIQCITEKEYHWRYKVSANNAAKAAEHHDQVHCHRSDREKLI